MKRALYAVIILETNEDRIPMMSDFEDHLGKLGIDYLMPFNAEGPVLLNFKQKEPS